MAIRTILEGDHPEGATLTINAFIHDELNVGIPAANVTSLKFTLYDLASDLILNNRTGVDVLNTGGGVLDSLGNFKLTLAPLDSPILGGTLRETHVVLFEWSYASGVKFGKHEVEFTVKNLSRVT